MNKINCFYHYLVKTEEIQSATEVNSRWTDTEDLFQLESVLSVHSSDCHGSWKGRGDNYRHHIQHTQDYPPWACLNKRKTRFLVKYDLSFNIFMVNFFNVNTYCLVIYK